MSDRTWLDDIRDYTARECLTDDEWSTLLSLAYDGQMFRDLNEKGHVVEFSATGYGLEHPATCRIEARLLDCPVEVEIRSLTENPFGELDFDRWMAQAKEIDALQAENIRLREQVSILEAGRCTSCMEPINPLHQQCACSRVEFEMLYHRLNETDTLRTQAEALAAALEHACSGQLSKVEWARVVDEADTALRAFREATP